VTFQKESIMWRAILQYIIMTLDKEPAPLEETGRWDGKYGDGVFP
jgi:hypothetical protein